jgi:hypothetical protein
MKRLGGRRHAKLSRSTIFKDVIAVPLFNDFFHICIICIRAIYQGYGAVGRN